MAGGVRDTCRAGCGAEQLVSSGETPGSHLYRVKVSFISCWTLHTAKWILI